MFDNSDMYFDQVMPLLTKTLFIKYAMPVSFDQNLLHPTFWQYLSSESYSR